MKNVFGLLILVLLFSCQGKNPPLKKYSGEALGTYYQIKFFAEGETDFEESIDSLFEVVNKSMSNYQDDSDISRINAGDSTIVVDHMFREVFLRSKKIYAQTEGYFDPTVGNLVNLYGFGAQRMTAKPDSMLVDSLMRFVGMEKVEIDGDNRIRKEFPETYLDFNGIAKGYAVDLLGLFLEKKGIENYLAEIGGEIRTKGENLQSGKKWRLGIDDPRLEQGEEHLSGILELKDRSMATSGNYRKFRYDSVSGQRYVHIVDPKSGYPKRRKILSASVLAEDCATADAFATAFMAMGIERAQKVAKEQPELDVFFIYDQDGELNTWLSDGFEEVMVKK